jgi:hypothetical protein
MLYINGLLKHPPFLVVSHYVRTMNIGDACANQHTNSMIQMSISQISKMTNK